MYRVMLKHIRTSTYNRSNPELEHLCIKNALDSRTSEKNMGTNQVDFAVPDTAPRIISEAGNFLSMTVEFSLWILYSYRYFCGSVSEPRQSFFFLSEENNGTPSSYLFISLLRRCRDLFKE